MLLLLVSFLATLIAILARQRDRLDEVRSAYREAYAALLRDLPWGQKIDEWTFLHDMLPPGDEKASIGRKIADMKELALPGEINGGKLNGK